MALQQIWPEGTRFHTRMGQNDILKIMPRLLNPFKTLPIVVLTMFLKYVCGAIVSFFWENTHPHLSHAYLA